MENREYEIGDVNVAQSWIESSLSGVPREDFLQFLHCFPTLTFYKESEAFLDQLEEAENIKLPRWFKDIRKTLAYLIPSQTEVKFGNFDDTDLEDMFSENWYILELGYIEAQREILQSIEEILPFPIGGSSDNPGSVLVISLANETNQQVYEYNVESLWDSMDEGEPLIDSFGAVFESYTEMFRHIVAVRVRNEEGIEVIQAQNSFLSQE